MREGVNWRKVLLEEISFGSIYMRSLIAQKVSPQLRCSSLIYSSEGTID